MIAVRSGGSLLRILVIEFRPLRNFGCIRTADPREDAMTLKTTRRRFVAGASAAAGIAAFPMPSIAQSAPLKIGLLT